MRRALTSLVLLTSGACAAPHAGLPYFRTAELTPEWLATRTANASAMHRVAPFTMTDQHGAPVSEHAFAGRVSIVHFFFTACGDVCPVTTANLQTFLRDLRDEHVQVLSYSVTPAHDSVAALQAYAARRGITDARWHLLTGSVGAVRRLATESYFTRLGDGSTYGVASIEHTETVLLIDSERRIRGVYASTLPIEMDRLRADVQQLLGPGTTSLASPK